MPTKKSQKKSQKRRTRKVQIMLPENLVKDLDREVRRMRSSGKEVSRAALMKEILGLGMVRRMILDSADPAGLADARDGLLSEAAPLAREAQAAEASGSRSQASRLYLTAAARELEAISCMSPSDESAIKSALIMVIHHLKRGTGYRHLPDVTVAGLPSDAVQ